MSALKNFRDIGRKIICVRRNYKARVKELGEKIGNKPALFMKSTSSYVTEGNPIKIPYAFKHLEHSVELGLVVGKDGTNISRLDALDYIGGYALALDMYAKNFESRDAAEKMLRGFGSFSEYQGEELAFDELLAKGFDTSCPVSDFIEKDKIKDPSKVNLWCKVNGQLKQQGSSDDMIFKIEEMIQLISHVISLQKGDLILTGTPPGVGPVNEGETIECGLEEGGKLITSMKFPVQKET